MAESVYLIYVARFLMGISTILGYVVMPMYLGEIASDKVRGLISATMSVMCKAGMLYAFAIAPYVAVKTFAWIALIPALLFVSIFLTLPESPYYYMSKGKTDQAFQSLLRLRNNKDIIEEYRKIDETIKTQQKNITYKELIQTKGNRKALIIIVGLSTLQQLCGSIAITAYSQTIFQKISGGSGASEMSIVFASVQLIVAFISSMIVDRVGRRPLLLISTIGVAICNSVIGIYFNLERNEYNVNDFSWIPITFVMLFIVSYGFGLATVTIVLLSELFPRNCKAIAGSCFMLSSASWQFVIIKLFQIVADGLGSDYIFFAFAFFSYIFIPFIWFLITETKGESFQNIQNELNKVTNKKEIESIEKDNETHNI